MLVVKSWLTLLCGRCMSAAGLTALTARFETLLGYVLSADEAGLFLNVKERTMYPLLCTMQECVEFLAMKWTLRLCRFLLMTTLPWVRMSRDVRCTSILVVCLESLQWLCSTLANLTL